MKNNENFSLEELVDSLSEEQRIEWVNIQKMFIDLKALCSKYADEENMDGAGMITAFGQMFSLLLSSYSKRDALLILESFTSTAKSLVK